MFCGTHLLTALIKRNNVALKYCELDVNQVWEC